jgi:uncharacterized protein YdbL (DUF1318 family)
MMIINRATMAFLFSMLLTLTACVTINVYFPASQAEAAAERIVDEILGEPDVNINNSDDQQNKDTSINFYKADQLFAAVGSFFISEAQAAQPDFSVNTPEIRRLQSAMAKRHKKLAGFYSKGAIGFSNNGQVAWRDKKAVSIKERGTLNSLLKAENKDRNNLYKAIANANGHPEWEADVRAVFAKKWAQKARKGWWYQTSAGSWNKK